MKLLLDTHALLWWLDDNPRLGAGAKSAIADDRNEVLVSIASLWEIAIKVRVGKLSADLRAIETEIDRNGFPILGLEIEHLHVLLDLPSQHRDPFDHLLIAQAIAADAALVSDDRRMSAYPVRLITCSDA